LRENERFFWREKCTKIRANGGTALGGGDNDGVIFELTP
jgi:hypothetical protein